jgi:hypothetical protein
MTLADIDKTLAQWESRLSTVAHNLFDLQNDPTYQCLTGTSGAPKTELTGVTANRITPALENVSTLFQCFDLLRCTIDRAIQIRAELPAMFGADQKERAIQQLLLGKSVRVPTEQIPIAKRSLLTGADEQGCITPDELLASMVKAFESARDGVAAIDTAWQQLGETLSEAARQVAILRAGPAPLDEGEARELDNVEHSLRLRQAQVQSDPLGTTLDLESTILPALQRVMTSVKERATIRDHIERALVSARAKLRELRELQRGAHESWSEAREKVTGAVALSEPVPEKMIDGLEEWLGTLGNKYSGGMLRPVAIGLQNWNSSAANCVSAVQKIYAANRASIDHRQELRGRLNALKAKAQAYRVEEDAGLRSVASEAESLLYTRPTPIDRADELVSRYQSLLNQRTTGGTRG